MASRNFPGPGVLVSSLVVLAGLAAAGATAQQREAVPPANQSATPQLSIVSGQSGIDLGTFQSSTSTFDQTFKIQSDDGAAASGLKVEAAFVSGPEGVPPDATAPRLNGQQGTLHFDALQSDKTHDIAFSASLPRPGDYEFTLRLIGPERRTHRFRVTRTAPVLSVVEAQGDTIALDTNSAGLRRALHLKTDTDVPAEAISVSMPELIGPNGRSVPLVSPAPNETSFDKIAGNQTVTFNIATSADGTDTALSESGSYHGTLEIGFLGGQKTYAVTVERTAPTLTIAEANGDTITLDTDSASFKRSLRLRTDTALPAQEVTVSMPELIGPGGRSVALVAPAPNGVAFNEIAGNQTRTFDIEAKLPETGDYRGTLVITYIGGQKTYAVTITKSLANASIAPTSTGTGRATMPFYGDATVALHVTLRENEGNSIRINKPAFTELKRQIGDITDISAVYSGAQFFAKANGPIDSWPLVLEPLEAEDLRVMIEGLGQPGSYSGKLLFSANDRGAVEVPVSFQLRRSWVWAGLAIVAGVVLSWFLRLWATTWRPRVIQVRKVLACVRDVDDVALAFGPLRTEEAEIFTRMRGLLARAYDGLRDGTATSADAAIASTKRKLALQPQWIARNRQIGALPADGRVEPLRQELATVRDYLMTADPATEEAAHGDAKTTIENLRTKITDLVRTLFADFQSEIVALGDDLDDELRHDPWTVDVVDVLSAARDALDREDIASAGAKIEEARKSAARILAQDLKKVLPPDEPPPDWLREPIFKRIQNALVDAETAENAHIAVAAFRRALSLYLEPFARHLMAVVESRLVADPPPDEDEITKLSEAKTGLAGVPQLVEAGKLPDARLACKVAADTLDRPLEGFAAAPNRLQAAALQAASETPAGSDVPDFPLPLPIDDRLPESPAGIERLVSRLSRLTANFDLLFQLIVMLVAVALGIQVLWAGNPTWGSTSDMFIALFWGLGLHSLATGATAYEGLSDLAGRFR